jgi:5'-nucleotidase
VDSEAAHIYANLTSKFVDTLLAGSTPILPPGISLNVNYPATRNCSTVSAFKFVLTRIEADPTAEDVNTCGSVHLPDESSVVKGSGCFASVSVFNASTKADVDAATQQFVLEKLGGLLTCDSDV